MPCCGRVEERERELRVFFWGRKRGRLERERGEGLGGAKEGEEEKEGN